MFRTDVYLFPIFEVQLSLLTLLLSVIMEFTYCIMEFTYCIMEKEEWLICKKMALNTSESWPPSSPLAWRTCSGVSLQMPQSINSSWKRCFRGSSGFHKTRQVRSVCRSSFLQTASKFYYNDTHLNKMHAFSLLYLWIFPALKERSSYSRKQLKVKKFTFGVETDTGYQVIWTAVLEVQVHSPEEFFFAL